MIKKKKPETDVTECKKRLSTMYSTMEGLLKLADEEQLNKRRCRILDDMKSVELEIPAKNESFAESKVIGGAEASIANADVSVSPRLPF